jgi:transposase-like protein
MTEKAIKKKPKIDEKRWAEIVRRFVVGGESASALARELGVTEGAIRKRAGTKRYEAKEVANQILTAHENYSRLPESTKNLVDDMVAILRGVSSNLASAAMAGTATSARLAAIANKQALKVDENNPMGTAEELQAIGALTKLSNESAQIGVALLNANKETMKQSAEQQEPQPIAVTIQVQDARKHA